MKKKNTKWWLNKMIKNMVSNQSHSIMFMDRKINMAVKRPQKIK